jgi:hypothetical protein
MMLAVSSCKNWRVAVAQLVMHPKFHHLAAAEWIQQVTLQLLKLMKLSRSCLPVCCCCFCFLVPCAVAKVSQTAINVMSGKSYEQEFELEQQRMAVSPCAAAAAAAEIAAEQRHLSLQPAVCCTCITARVQCHTKKSPTSTSKVMFDAHACVWLCQGCCTCTP